MTKTTNLFLFFVFFTLLNGWAFDLLAQDELLTQRLAALQQGFSEENQLNGDESLAPLRQTNLKQINQLIKGFVPLKPRLQLLVNEQSQMLPNCLEPRCSWARRSLEGAYQLAQADPSLQAHPKRTEILNALMEATNQQQQAQLGETGAQAASLAQTKWALKLLEEEPSPKDSKNQSDNSSPSKPDQKGQEKEPQSGQSPPKPSDPSSESQSQEAKAAKKMDAKEAQKELLKLQSAAKEIREQRAKAMGVRSRGEEPVEQDW